MGICPVGICPDTDFALFTEVPVPVFDFCPLSCDGF